MNGIYLIKDLAKLSGHTSYTVKYYLNLGLIKEVGRSPETNFRYFDNTTLERLKKTSLKSRSQQARTLIFFILLFLTDRLSRG
jgi:DNA-binding transcriptional MerR regulator